MFGMLSVLAGLHRELIVANTNDRLASARGRGRAGAGRGAPRARPRSLNGSMTSGRRLSNRSPTCSASPGRRCTGTSTRPTHDQLLARCPAYRELTNAQVLRAAGGA